MDINVTEVIITTDSKILTTMDAINTKSIDWKYILSKDYGLSINAKWYISVRTV